MRKPHTHTAKQSCGQLKFERVDAAFRSRNHRISSGQNRLGNRSGESGDATFSINRVVGSAQRPRFRFTCWYTDADNDMNYIDGAGQLSSTTDLLTALQFKMSSGNINSGVFCLYGRAKS